MIYFKQKLLLFLSVLSFFFVFIACQVTENTTTINSTTSQNQTTLTSSQTDSSMSGIYVLTDKTIDGIDMSEMAVFEVLVLGGDQSAKLRRLDLYGLHEEIGSYEEEDNGVAILFGLRTYTYQYNEETKSLNFEGQVNRREVYMSFTRNDQFEEGDSIGSVSFYDELFRENEGERFYNYAPSVMIEGNDTMHIWYCGNLEDGDVTDYITYRKGTLMSDGKWIFSDKVIVLGPTEGTWDERHTCDPDVVKGNFSYHGQSYNYLMTYLGCVTSDNSDNEVGIAVAKKPEGPWIKVDEINPIANYYESDEYTDEVWTWGYGQPSLVSVNKDGEVLLFYTKGVATGTFEYVEHWDLSDLDNPQKLGEAMIRNLGVTNAIGGFDVINNASFAYDHFRGRLYMVKEDFPYPEADGVTWITGSNTVFYLDLNLDSELWSDILFSEENYRWQFVDTITTAKTGFARNHNMGLVTDEYGWVINPYKLGIVYTMSLTDQDELQSEWGGFWQYLGTYRMYGTSIDLN